MTNWNTPQTIIAQRGFSLIETTIALSIVAVTLLSVIALMGGVATTSGETMDRFATARIFQSIAHDYQMKDWETILQADGKQNEIIYFDEKGEESKKGEFETIYAARVALDSAAEWPGLSEAAATKLAARESSSDESRRLKVEVSSRVMLADPFSDKNYVREFTTLLVKLDQ